MKVAIPVTNDHSKKNELATGLNVLGFICIFDTDNNEGKWLRTTDLAPNMGELLPALEKLTVKAIITKQIHPMALKVLVDRGLFVFKAEGNRVDENVTRFVENQLYSFDMDGAMTFAKICGGECSSCSTECDDEKK